MYIYWNANSSHKIASSGSVIFRYHVWLLICSNFFPFRTREGSLLRKYYNRFKRTMYRNFKFCRCFRPGQLTFTKNSLMKRYWKALKPKLVRYVINDSVVFEISRVFFSGFAFLLAFSRAAILSLWVRKVLYHFNGLITENTLATFSQWFFHGFINCDKVTEWTSFCL